MKSRLRSSSRCSMSVKPQLPRARVCSGVVAVGGLGRLALRRRLGGGGDGLDALLLLDVAAHVAQALAELAHGLAEALGHLRQPARAEHEQHDDQEDQDLGQADGADYVSHRYASGADASRTGARLGRATSRAGQEALRRATGAAGRARRSATSAPGSRRAPAAPTSAPGPLQVPGRRAAGPREEITPSWTALTRGLRA